MKTNLLLLVFLLCIGIHYAYAQDNVIDEVVWIVGDEAILKSEVEAERLNAQYSGTRFDGDPYCVIPEELALQKLFLHQAIIDSIEVSESDVSRSVEMKINQLISQIGSKEKLEEYYNMSTTKIREELRDKARDVLIMQEMQSHIIRDVKVTPAEVRRYFKNLPTDSIPYIPTQVEVQILTLEPQIPEEEIERVKARLREFTERINSGEMQFSTLALLYSEDKGSAIRGGELGFMGRGSLVAEYANAAFNLTDPTKVSKIVESEFGFHIIQLIEKRGDRINTRHILLKPQVAEENLMYALNRLDTISDNIRSNQISFENAASQYSSDKDTRMNNGLMPNPMTRTSKFEMQDLPQEVARAVERLEIGEISRPFTMIDSKGKEICAIIKLKSRVKGHKATLAEDFQSIKNIVLEKKQMEKLDKWIREKQRTTYVRINEKWKNCEFKYPGWVH